MLLSPNLLLYGLPTLVLLVFAVQLARLYKLRLRHQQLLASFPGPKPHWWYGNTHQIGGNIEGLLKTVKLANAFSGIIPVWSGPVHVTLLSVHPSTSRAILAGTDPKDEYSYAMLGPWMGEGLLLQSGSKWDRTRRLLLPAFHNEILKSYMTVFAETLKELVAKWQKASEPVEVFHHASLLTMDSMLRCLFGHRSHCQPERTRHPYIQAVYELSDLIVKRIDKPHLMIDSVYYLTPDGRRFKKECDRIHSYSKGLIQARRRLLQNEKLGTSTRKMDFLDILMTARDSDGNGLNDQEIQDEVDTFMFAGHDSTASSLSWCLYNLASHLDCQAACRKEAAKILGTKSQFTWEDIKHMETITACIQESMRLYPAVPNLSRFTAREIPLPDGRIIPKGIRVAVSLFALHRNHELWTDPEVYDPDRFLNSSNLSESNYYMPFSIGPRNCIGKNFALIQLKIAVATILLSFKVDVVPDRLPVPESSLVLRSKDGVYLNVSPL